MWCILLQIVSSTARPVNSPNQVILKVLLNRLRDRISKYRTHQTNPNQRHICSRLIIPNRCKSSLKYIKRLTKSLLPITALLPGIKQCRCPTTAFKLPAYAAHNVIVATVQQPLSRGCRMHRGGPVSHASFICPIHFSSCQKGHTRKGTNG